MFRGTKNYPLGLVIGLDVGSCAVKAVVVDMASDRVLWKKYRRHETRQPETCLDFLEEIAEAFPDVPDEAFRVFTAGTGGMLIAGHIGAKHVQEVNAITLAVEKRFPETCSIVELGGQDAKIIIFSEDPATGRIRKLATMNDKCAGGTGTVIDKISAKLKVSAKELSEIVYSGAKVHSVAGKCGVFAETDINSLQKQGIANDELLASLFTSIVQQNLSVLTRGSTLRPKVLLLGGPNHFIKGLVECWRIKIAQLWDERKIELPPDTAIEELIVVPCDALYFPALGAVDIARREMEDDPEIGLYQGLDKLKWYLDIGRGEEKKSQGGAPLVKDERELISFKEKYQTASRRPLEFTKGTTVEAFIGLDAGSTSTKAVLIDSERTVIAKAYQLSEGNPIKDAKEVLAALEEQVTDQGCKLDILGVATTGYAKDILKEVIGADVALVETVAHAQSGLHYYPDADVICDIGGQDIKIIMLHDGVIRDFKLNTQCSAGNGYFLQSTAEDFGYRVEEYADYAFSAKAVPNFGYGCAVFLQSDIVDSQRKGWQANEILAGLARVLPKNVWHYIAQAPNLQRLGRTFILQGGTQHNLAAVKAQVDFIEAQFADAEIGPTIVVHKHCGEAGAIGCAFEVYDRFKENGLETDFIGMDALRSLTYESIHNEETRCSFCKNKCMRTFIDVHVSRSNGKDNGAHTKIERRRTIIAPCEKGSVEEIGAMKSLRREIEAKKKKHVDLANISAKEAFKPVRVNVAENGNGKALGFFAPFRSKRSRKRRELIQRRKDIRIGMPRVLHMYSCAPFFMAYFQSLGIPADNLIWSDYTSERLYKDGAKRGSIDPCFPSKVAIPHVHNLITKKHSSCGGLDYIFFPLVDTYQTYLTDVQASRACPAATATPEAVHAAFTKESDVFAEMGIVHKKPMISLGDTVLCAHQMYEAWRDEIGVSESESKSAVEAGMEAMREFNKERRREAREVIDRLEAENGLGIVLLSRPYHNDLGLNHGICEDLQKLGYDVLTQDSLPHDKDLLERLFGEEVAAGKMRSPFDISDVWTHSYSENSSRKLWAAKFVARHPNLVALELSSFKCGHDAPILSTIEKIMESSGTPFFYFRDIDENKPTGAIRLRIETIDYFLKRHRERIMTEEVQAPTQVRGGDADEGKEALTAIDSA